MKYFWSYHIVAFCAVVTSARVMDFPGNRNGFQDNFSSSVKEEKVWTPPTTSGLIIDSNGYPGNSNETRIKNFTDNDFPLLFSKLIAALSSQNKQFRGYEIIPFSKEDIVNMENSELCKIMCTSGVKKPPCKCE